MVKEVYCQNTVILRVERFELKPLIRVKLFTLASKIIYSGERLFFKISVICSDIYAVYYKDRSLRGCGMEGFELGGIRIGSSISNIMGRAILICQ